MKNRFYRCGVRRKKNVGWISRGFRHDITEPEMYCLEERRERKKFRIDSGNRCGIIIYLLGW